LSFLIIGIGGLLFGGYLSQTFGAKVAFTSLLLSCACCLVFPFLFAFQSTLFLAFLLFLGMVVVADSPLLSTLVAQNAPAEIKELRLQL
jgi:MFS family permease